MEDHGLKAPSLISRTLRLRLHGDAEAPETDVAIRTLVIAGWTGRDPVAVEKHIRELEALGVRRPASTPIFYRVAATRLTTDASIEVLGDQSGGEVEFVLLQHARRLWVGVGSDHTDRQVETYGVAVSKQMCEKPIAPVFWPMEDVADHWDQLILRSYVSEGATPTLYQVGPVASMLSPKALLARFSENGRLEESTLMFCGTLAARGGVRPTTDFSFELEDPVLKRTIRHAYRAKTLPILG